MNHENHTPHEPCWREDTRRLEKAAQEFLESFERVFNNDWEFTRDAIATGGCGIMPTGEDATFLYPGVEDPSNNWHNRGALLSDYEVLENELERLRQRHKDFRLG